MYNIDISSTQTPQQQGYLGENVGGRVPLLAPNISDLSPKMVRINADKWLKITNCVQIKEEIKDFTWMVSDCEELVGG